MPRQDISNARSIFAQFAEDDSGVTLTMGETRVMTVVTAALEPPYPDRANEGSLRINVEFSPMASPNFEPGRPGDGAVSVAPHHAPHTFRGNLPLPTHINIMPCKRQVVCLVVVLGMAVVVSPCFDLLRGC